MQTQGDRIHQLYHQWLNGETNPAEEGELRTLLMENNLSESLYAAMQKVFENTEDDPSFPIKKRQEIAAKIMNMHPATAEAPAIVVHRVRFMKTAWFRYAAAILIMIGIGAYLWNTQRKEKPLITTTKPVPVKNDVAPGSNRAVLTLSDGRKVELTPETGSISESGITIENANGRLEYGKAEKSVSNTMTTPKGGQYKLTLADGTKVWLNAASSITYPTAFKGQAREVAITGEAYFEVTKNKEKPFIVRTQKDVITVLGTSFNVNSYPDEKMKTSLLEGSVKINDVVLKPGQAYLNQKIVPTDLSQDVAWKNGLFNFQNLSLEQAMRQLARWYDVEIRYEGKRRDFQFEGEIDRSLTLGQVIKGLEGIEGLHFELDGKVLSVSY